MHLEISGVKLKVRIVANGWCNNLRQIKMEISLKTRIHWH